MKLYGAVVPMLRLFGAAEGESIAACQSSATGKVPAPSVAPGWESAVVTSDLTYPRGIVFDSAGHLLIADRGVGVRALTFNDDGGTCVTVNKSTLVVNNPALNHGIAIMNGNILLASDPSAVYAYGYDPKTMSTTTVARTIIDGMNNTDHDTRTITVSLKSPGTVIINRGSESNIDTLAAVKSSGHAQVKAFDLSGLDPTKPYKSMNFTTSGKLLAWGVRNDVGIAEAPHTGGIWAVENSVDDIERDGVEFAQENPGEKLNYMGTLINNASPNQGSNFGYPQCFAAWNASQVPEQGSLKTGQQFSIDPSISDEECQTQRTAPRLVFNAHMAPLDIKFGSAGINAYISFHGSYDRPVPEGYKVSRVVFENGEPTSPSTSHTAVIDIASNYNTTRCPTDCFRPVGLAFDSVGRLFFSSDVTGEVYVLRHLHQGN